MSAGRMCPADYRYAPTVFDRPAEIACEVVYVVGGLYGNLGALAAVERLAAAEQADVTIVFNGDFHWFDAERSWFAAIERGVGGHAAIRGNVETEIARPHDIGAGCGCAYPETVDDGAVTRSNQILFDLRGQAATAGDNRRLAALPMHLVAAVGGLKIGIVHGDAVSLAGWRFDVGALDDPANRSWLADIRRKANIEVFASSHTCLAALRDFDFAGGRMTVINNGAAGMPNFSGSRFGLVSRIATRPSPHAPLYGLFRDDVFIDALAVRYDTPGFLNQFLSRWPAGSPAHQSYFRRIVDGPSYEMASARLAC